MTSKNSRISIVDSHTAGEPTRVVVEGAPKLGGGSVADQLKVLKTEHDWLRTATILEPRGSDVIVGAVLTPPSDSSCVAGVIFYNNVGYLGMCGHGTIGVIKTLAHLGRIKPGTQRLETPVGVVSTTLYEDGSVSLANVPSYRKVKQATVEAFGIGPITGDVVWSGNWFFIVDAGQRKIGLDRVAELTEVCWKIRRAVNKQGYPDIDHVELYGPPANPEANSQNFVHCPGGAYDRSPCGTGTSAKMACLAADGKLAEGQKWIQESIVGTCFTGSYRWLDREKGVIEPTIRGVAYVNAETTMVIDRDDPFRFGLMASAAPS
ncbi:MAG TPA: proline racemase family protein [Pirellulales bacterium]|jgi:proline racemase